MEDKIWPWFDGKYKVYCTKPEDYDRISRWKDVEVGGTYYFPNGAVTRDLIVPPNLANKAAKLLGVTLRVRRPMKRTKPPLQVVGGQ